jgi:hypothetical protein
LECQEQLWQYGKCAYGYRRSIITSIKFDASKLWALGTIIRPCAPSTTFYSKFLGSYSLAKFKNSTSMHPSVSNSTALFIFDFILSPFHHLVSSAFFHSQFFTSSLFPFAFGLQLTILLFSWYLDLYICFSFFCSRGRPVSILDHQLTMIIP